MIDRYTVQNQVKDILFNLILENNELVIEEAKKVLGHLNNLKKYGKLLEDGFNVKFCFMTYKYIETELDGSWRTPKDIEKDVEKAERLRIIGSNHAVNNFLEKLNINDQNINNQSKAISEYIIKNELNIFSQLSSNTYVENCIVNFNKSKNDFNQIKSNIIQKNQILGGYEKQLLDLKIQKSTLKLNDPIKDNIKEILENVNYLIEQMENTNVTFIDLSNMPYLIEYTNTLNERDKCRSLIKQLNVSVNTFNFLKNFKEYLCEIIVQDISMHLNEKDCWVNCLPAKKLLDKNLEDIDVLHKLKQKYFYGIFTETFCKNVINTMFFNSKKIATNLISEEVKIRYQYNFCFNQIYKLKQDKKRIQKDLIQQKEIFTKEKLTLFANSNLYDNTYDRVPSLQSLIFNNLMYNYDYFKESLSEKAKESSFILNVKHHIEKYSL